MIKIEKYKKEFEKEYFTVVKSKVPPKDQKKIVKYLENHFSNLIEGEITFEKWILADYETIKKAYDQVPHYDGDNKDPEIFTESKGKLKAIYKRYYKAYDAVREETIDGKKVNIYLVNESKIDVCPYCNRNYITARGETVSGAQLDHFINRSQYPIFALCLYNLVPCCNVCNLIKKKKELKISPFDQTLNDGCVTFTKTGTLLEDNLAVKVDAKGDIGVNMDVLRLQEAYDFHIKDLKELVELREMYPETQLDEICELINGERRTAGKADLNSTDIRNMIFGKQVPYEEYGKKPLSKFRHDILKQLNIYTSE